MGAADTPHAPAQRAQAALKITPGKKSPSILPLERNDWVAVSAMVVRKAVPEIIDKLIAVGATDVLVFSLANCRV